MTTNKVLIGTRFDSNRVKTLAKIAKKLNISKNAVIENALDLYAESILGDSSSKSDRDNGTYEDRLKAVELALAEMQVRGLSEMIVKLTPQTPQSTPQ